jgi:hypothetical protein
MKFITLLVAGAALFSAAESKKTLAEIATKGKLLEIAEKVEKIIDNGLQVDDIVAFTPRFEESIPEMIE